MKNKTGMHVCMRCKFTLVRQVDIDVSSDPLPDRALQGRLHTKIGLKIANLTVHVFIHIHVFRQEKMESSSDTLSDRGCCQDFTRPCEVPPFPDISEAWDGDIFRSDWWEVHQELSRELPATEGNYHNWHTAYGKGGLFWPYGGAGTFLSAGMLEKVQGDDGNGWERCTEIFGVGYSTDIQVMTLFWPRETIHSIQYTVQDTYR